MTAFFTTRELTDLLQIDRTTIYRMADAGRIPAVKVGNQWRFPREEVRRWLGHASQAAPASPAPQPTSRPAFALESVQPLQDVMADALGVMLLIVDLNGQPLTRPSHPCGLYAALDAHPSAQIRCLEMWARLGQAPGLQPVWVESHAGPLLTRALIRVGSNLAALLIAGGIAPPDWPPDPPRREALAHALGVPRSLLDAHIHEVFWLSDAERARVLGLVQRLADVVGGLLDTPPRPSPGWGGNLFLPTLGRVGGGAPPQPSLAPQSAIVTESSQNRHSSLAIQEPLP